MYYIELSAAWLQPSTEKQVFHVLLCYPVYPIVTSGGWSLSARLFFKNILTRLGSNSRHPSSNTSSLIHTASFITVVVPSAIEIWDLGFVWSNWTAECMGRAGYFNEHILAIFPLVAVMPEHSIATHGRKINGRKYVPSELS